MNTPLVNPLAPSTQLKGIIFDKDGTLVDLNVTWGHAMSMATLEVCSDDEEVRVLSTLLGLDTRTKQFLEDSMTPATDLQTTSQIISTVTDPVKFGMIARKYALESAKTTEGADELLNSLSATGYKLGLATNDSVASATEFLKLLGWSGLFGVVKGFDSGHGSKPGPGMLEACAINFSATHDEVIMVGDTINDLRAAKAAEICYVQLGPLSHPSNEAPDITIDSLNQLVNVLSN